MKTSLKISLSVVALALLGYVVVLISRPDEPAAASVTETSGGPSFEVRVVKPRIARPLFGLIPESLFKSTDYAGQQRFGHTSRGAEAVGVGPDRLELRADGWHLLIETDGRGAIARGTRLVFPIELAEVRRTLRCRPAEPAVGYLRAAAREGSGELDGQFQVELATCENAETGKVIDTEAGGNPGQAWPSEPLILRGSFAGLPHGRR